MSRELIKASAPKALIINPRLGTVLFEGELIPYDEFASRVGENTARTVWLNYRKQDLAQRNEPPPRIDLIRRCAVHQGLPWGAAYILQSERDGEITFDYSGSFPINKDLYWRQYAGKKQSPWADKIEIGEERCGQCGMIAHYGEGGVFKCGSCGQQVCGGLATGSYFRCYCGGAGWAEKGDFPNIGIVPGF
jgi:hypothetical protein